MGRDMDTSGPKFKFYAVSWFFAVVGDWSLSDLWRRTKRENENLNKTRQEEESVYKPKIFAL